MSSNRVEAGDQRTVLSFHDSFLRNTDLATLNRGNWLNDPIISFYLEYLDNNVFKNIHDDAAFLAAGAVQLMKSLGADDLREMFKNIAKKKIVFMPLNNCEISQGGGSHWSLVIYFDRAFYHLDSSQPMNSSCAKTLCKQLHAIFGEKIPIIEVACPSQTNSSDCGVYVLEFTEVACAAFAEAGTFSQDVFKLITPEGIRKKRKTIEDIIRNLRENENYSHL